MASVTDPDYLEVEIRYRLLDEDRERLLLELSRLGFSPCGSTVQRDVYYTSRHKDFVETEECLRIRHVGTRATITWKPPTTAAMRRSDQFWKEEIDLRIGRQFGVARRLLCALDFVEYVTVIKERTVYRRHSSSTEVAVDCVEGLGSFVELESQSLDAISARRRNRELARCLGLDPRCLVTIPYRDLVRAGMRDHFPST